MSRSGEQPNLLPPRSRMPRVLLFGISIVPAVIGFVLVGAFFNDDSGTATITDRVPTPILSEQETRTPEPPSPILSETTATALARGSGRDTVRWFDEGTGQAYEGNLYTGSVRPISNAPVSGFVTGVWVPGAEQAFIVSENAQNGKVYRLYDYRSGDTFELEPNIVVLAVSPDSSRIAYVVPGPNTSFLIKTANIDGSDAEIIFRTRLGISALAWQSRERLLFVAWRQAAVRTDLLSLTLDGTVVSVLTNKENLEFTVSERGSVLVSYYDKTAGVIATIDPATAKAVSLIDPVSARKCGWAPSGWVLVCGIAKNATSGRGSSLAASQDSLVVIDTTIGLSDPISLNEKDWVSVFTPVVSSSGTRAAFIDLFDRRVHVVEL